MTPAKLDRRHLLGGEKDLARRNCRQVRAGKYRLSTVAGKPGADASSQASDLNLDW